MCTEYIISTVSGWLVQLIERIYNWFLLYIMIL